MDYFAVLMKLRLSHRYLMPEMAVTAKALDLAVPLVLGFHLVRTVLCNLLVGPIWRAAVALGLDRQPPDSRTG